MGFCEKLSQWIKACLESSSISVLVNESPTKEFKPSRGLRLGDLISPLLFLIVAQGLLGLVNQATRKEVLFGLKVGANNVEVKLLQFVNDTLFLCDSNIQNIRTFKAMSKCFESTIALELIFLRAKLVL